LNFENCESFLRDIISLITFGILGINHSALYFPVRTLSFAFSKFGYVLIDCIAHTGLLGQISLEAQVSIFGFNVKKLFCIEITSRVECKAFLI
jgi:hypothetical protein